jgi:hypothetical protein
MISGNFYKEKFCDPSKVSQALAEVYIVTKGVRRIERIRAPFVAVVFA